MATLTGTQIANTYKQLLQVGSGNNGLTASVQSVQDGQGNNSPLQLSQSAVNIDGTFQLNGVTLTANASALNDIADLTGATGIIAVSGGNVYGRTLTGGTGVSITNADGTEGNPTIALNPTGVVSASYGPATNIEINSVGQVVSAGAATSVSVSGVTANTFTGGTFAGTTGDFSSNVSVGGNLVIAGQFSPASLSVTGTINAAKISATDATFNNNVSVGGNLVVTGQLSPAALSVTGTVNATKISATNATFNSVVSAGFFVGDGSGLTNVPSLEGGTVKAITAGTGIKLTVDAAVTTTIPVSGTVAVSANQNFGSVSVSTALAVTGSALFGIVSATNIDTDELLIAGVSAATVTEVAAVSALTQINLDSITSINTVVANVSALTSVNAAAITSINGIIEGNVSADSGTFNTLTVVTSASVGGTLNVGGNVGADAYFIGSDPSYLYQSATDTVTLRVGADGPYMTVGKDLGSDLLGIGNASGAVALLTSGSERVRIDSTGNVLIGTTSDTTDLAYAPKLKLSGSGPVLYLEETDASQDYSITALGGKFYIRDATAVVPRLTIDSSGNVGIGTSSPDRLFEVEEASGDAWMRLRASDTGGGADTIFENLVADNSQNNYIYFGDLDDTNIGMIRYSHASNFMSFTTNTAERMRIDSSGNVGIGTSSPRAPLHVYPSGSATDDFNILVSQFRPNIVLEDLSSSVVDFQFFVDSNALQFRYGDASTDTKLATEAMRIDSSGNVGIGTSSPSTKLGFPIGNNIKISQVAGTAHAAGNVGSLALTIADGGGHSGVFVNNTHNGTYSSQDITFLTAEGGVSSATERMVIDSSGNVGINTTTTLGTKFFVSQGAAASPATSGNMTTGAVIGSSTSGQALNLGTDADGVWYNAAYANNAGVARIHRWLTGGTERMRIDSSGTLLVGMTASSDSMANTGIELYNDGRLNATRSGNPVLYLNRKTSSGTIVTFRLDGSEEGTISIDSSSGVSYNTTSDYRLKENVTEVTGAAERVKALNPVRFNFIAAPDKIVDGFLAHEVSDIVPEAIHGEKDAVDAEGNPKYQGIDQSKLVPLLTAALQEALTKIDELEARVAALETA